jgi:septal ring factor EnvC (AmiA/AmiB activator)
MRIILLFLFTISIQASSILDKVKDLDYKISEISKSIENHKNTIIKLEKNIENSKLRIKNLKSRNKKLEISIKKRVKYLFKLININNFSQLIESKDALNIERKEKFLKIVINNDINLIRNYLKKLKEINDVVNVYEKQIKDLKKNQLELELKRKNFMKERNEKKKFLISIKKSKTLNKKLNKEKKLISKKINKKLISRNLNSSFLKMKGQLDFPVNSKVYKWYYVRYIKSKKSYDMHKGLTFKIPIGTRVHSIYKGNVVFASYIKGYGNTVIISHGSGYYSIYMHLSKILKDRGERVNGRDVIALTGDTGSTEYPKLYFEIRKKKNPINLNKWFNIKK